MLDKFLSCSLAQYILIRASDPKKSLCATVVQMSHCNLLWILLASVLLVSIH